MPQLVALRQRVSKIKSLFINPKSYFRNIFFGFYCQKIFQNNFSIYTLFRILPFFKKFFGFSVVLMKKNEHSIFNTEYSIFIFSP